MRHFACAGSGSLLSRAPAGGVRLAPSAIRPRSVRRVTILEPGSVGGCSLGLPVSIRACLFDLDGVLTETARLHAAAWKTVLDPFLAARSSTLGTPFVAFDDVHDYNAYVDGRTRVDGIRSFLRSRGIDVAWGSRSDGTDAATINGLSAAKDAVLMRSIRLGGVRAFPGSVRYLRAVAAAGLPMGVVSASVHCAEILRIADLADLFRTRIDGVTVEVQHLPGKPDPATYLAAARALGVEPDATAVFEDALPGIAAGRAGGFGWVVGVDRTDAADALRAHGADRVVHDLADLLDPVVPT